MGRAPELLEADPQTLPSADILNRCWETWLVVAHSVLVLELALDKLGAAANLRALVVGNSLVAAGKLDILAAGLVVGHVVEGRVGDDLRVGVGGCKVDTQMAVVLAEVRRKVAAKVQNLEVGKLGAHQVSAEVVGQAVAFQLESRALRAHSKADGWVAVHSQVSTPARARGGLSPRLYLESLVRAWAPAWGSERGSLSWPSWPSCDPPSSFSSLLASATATRNRS